jgi:hypothetical protein
MTITKLGTVALTSILLAGGPAAASNLEGTSNATYFEVNLRYCIPASTAAVDTPPAPKGAAAVVYADVLMGAHGGDCEAFYVREIRPRLYLDEFDS